MSIEKAVERINVKIDNLIISGLDTKAKKKQFNKLSKMHKTLTTEYDVLAPVFKVTKIKN